MDNRKIGSLKLECDMSLAKLTNKRQRGLEIAFENMGPHVQFLIVDSIIE